MLNWGLLKDLLLPFAEQPTTVNKGEQVLVRLYLDQSGRIAASARVVKFLQPADGSLKLAGPSREECAFYQAHNLSHWTCSFTSQPDSACQIQPRQHQL